MRYVLDAAQMLTKEEAHTYLKEVFGFPEYYGRNLDALYDFLSEKEDVSVEVKNFSEEHVYMKQVLRVMKDAGVRVC